MRFLLPLVLAVACVFLAAFTPSGSASGSPPEAVSADTVRLSVRSGEPLVMNLPGEPAWTYRALRAPALSWLVGRSFYWKTLPAERGREFVLIERRHRSEPQDTLVLVVDVGVE